MADPPDVLRVSSRTQSTPAAYRQAGPPFGSVTTALARPIELRKVASQSPPGADALSGPVVVPILIAARGIIDAFAMGADEFEDASREMNS